jgi:excinuclease ABC subunit C
MMSDPFDLATYLSKLTSEPGVYRMLDTNRQVLYVGKAANLKKRVSSYFNKANLGVKTHSLVGQIASIEVSVTRTETEALLLESSLIKSLRPKYNILMRDDKSYPYIYVTHYHKGIREERYPSLKPSVEAFPRLTMLRSKKRLNEGAFGPYPNVTALKETLTIIQKIFKISQRHSVIFKLAIAI